ncbi:MAG: hypothetical protein AAGA70_02115 [Pseudomonadota bacterium]
MRKVLVAAGFVAWAAGASAQGTIRSGEHGDYTRIVVPIGSDRDYELRGTGPVRQVILTPPGSFNSSRVFDTLSTGRLAGIDSDGDVTLELGCRCEIEAYRFENSFLVLDIYDVPEPAVEEVSAILQRPSVEVLPQPAGAPTIDRVASNGTPYRPQEPLDLALLAPGLTTLPRLRAFDQQPSAAAPETAGDMEPMMVATDEGAEPPVSSRDDMQPDSDMVDMMIVEPAAPTSEPDMPTMPAEPVEPPEEISQTAAALAEQLARAAAAGLLETAATEPLGAADPPAPSSPADEDMADEVPEAADPTGLPVRAANAFDVAGNREGALAALTAALSCAQPIGDISNWSSGLGFEHDLGALRQAAFDGNGNLIAGPTIDLARHYIFHGFGAEAEAWLLQLPDPPEIELAMARYLDNRPGPNFPTVETLALCTGLDLLWRFVDAPEFPELSMTQRQDMRLAFNALPLGLRRLLGPDFVRRLSAEGYTNDAAEIREALERGPTLDATEELLLIVETSPDPASAARSAALEETLQVAGPEIPRVMREYLTSLRETGDLPGPDQVQAAEALLRETPPDFELESLWYEVLLAHARLGDSDAMFRTLSDFPEGNRALRGEIETALMETLLETDQDAVLVVMATQLSADPAGILLPRNTRIETFDVLMRLGLATLAEPFRTSARPIETSTPVTGQNWAAEAIGTNSPAADVARRLAQIDAGDGPIIDPENPDTVRAALDDSRAMRDALSDLLGPGAAN